VRPVKRLAVASMVLASIGSVEAPARAIPRPLPPILIFRAIGGGCYFYLSNPVPHQVFGYGITFSNQTRRARKVVERAGFFHFEVRPDHDKHVRIHAAGTYAARCDGGKAQKVFRAALKAPSAPANHSFSVAWADDTAGAAWRYDVQYRIGSGTWTTWKQKTTARSATFSGNASTTYFFRARATIPTAGTNGWSPVRKVVT
jgi:hypothetical protein